MGSQEKYPNSKGNIGEEMYVSLWLTRWVSKNTKSTYCLNFYYNKVYF